MIETDIQDQVSLLHAKRGALEQGLRFAALVENLNQSLNASLMGGGSSAAMPAEALDFYEALDPLSRSLPAELLSKRIQKLSRQIQQDFGIILNLTRLIRGQSNESSNGGQSTADTERFLSHFAEHSARLLGMRVALYKLGESSKPLQLELPLNQLEKRLHAIEALEDDCRRRVRRDILTLQKDIRELMQNDQLPAATRQELKHIRTELHIALEHIDSGGDINQIPVAVKTLQWDSTPLSSDDLAKILEGEQVQELPVEEITITAPENLPEPTFNNVLYDWLNTPLDVTWDQSKQREKRRMRRKKP